MSLSHRVIIVSGGWHGLVPVLCSDWRRAKKTLKDTDDGSLKFDSNAIR